MLPHEFHPTPKSSRGAHSPHRSAQGLSSECICAAARASTDSPYGFHEHTRLTAILTSQAIACSMRTLPDAVQPSLVSPSAQLRGDERLHSSTVRYAGTDHPRPFHDALRVWHVQHSDALTQTQQRAPSATPPPTPRRSVASGARHLLTPSLRISRPPHRERGTWRRPIRADGGMLPRSPSATRIITSRKRLGTCTVTMPTTRAPRGLSVS